VKQKQSIVYNAFVQLRDTIFVYLQFVFYLANGGELDTCRERIWSLRSPGVRRRSLRKPEGNQHKTNLFITTDDLSICVLDRRHVRVAERSAHKAQYQGTLSDTARSENDHSVVVALLWHYVFSPPPPSLYSPVPAAVAVTAAAEN